jgi:hypothetical protein
MNHFDILYKAILKRDPAVAKYCAGHLWKDFKGSDYLKWKMVLLFCRVSYHQIVEITRVLDAEDLTGSKFWGIIYGLTMGGRAVDAQALMLLSGLPPPHPYEVKFFLDALAITQNVDVPFAGKKTPISYDDRLIYRAACFLIAARESVEDPIVMEAPKIQAAKALPDWTNDPIKDLLVEATSNLTMIDNTLLHLKATDNVLWPFWLGKQC